MSKAQESENSWLIDLILSFFHSPEWKAPVLSFIEEKWIVFDDEEENKLEYTVIHKEFKHLTEGLIEAMLAELGASAQMFGDAMEKAAETPGYQKINKIIESIDDYQLFHKMMKKKNASLNEAAFKMLTEGPATRLPPTSGEKYIETPGMTQITKGEPVSSTADGKTVSKGTKLSKNPNNVESFELTDIEKEQMEIIRLMSLREEEELKKIEEEEQRILQQVLELSKKENEEEIAKKETLEKEKNFQEKERQLKIKEQELLRKEEEIRKEKERLLTQKAVDKPIAFLSEFSVPTVSNVDSSAHVKTNVIPVAAVAPLGDKKPKKKKKVIKAPIENAEVKKDMDLPPVMQHRHAGGNMIDADYDFMKEASSDILKKKERIEHNFDSYADFDPSYDPFKQDKKEELSMKQLMAQKMK